MSTRNLDSLFQPKSVAVVGADEEAGTVGAVLRENLFGSGFEGHVMPISATAPAVAGAISYPDVDSLPDTPDLAVIHTDPGSLRAYVEAFARRGTKAVIITSDAVDPGEERAAEAREALAHCARPYGLRILGTNSLGALVPRMGLNASFSPITPVSGRIAFVAQSQTIVSSVLSWAHARGIGFSHLVSLGDIVDIDFGDLLDYLANDPGTQSILLYIEQVTAARKFMSAARAAARTKPVLVVKAGRHGERPPIGGLHIHALADTDAVYDAVFRRAGMLRVRGLEELFDAVETLAMAHPPRGERLAILTNGAGIGLIASDALLEDGGQLAELQADTIDRLASQLWPRWNRRNPVDIGGTGSPEVYGGALSALVEDRGVDAVLVINCHSAVSSRTEAARAVASAVAGRRSPTILTSWVGDEMALDARRIFAEHRIPTYVAPDQAVRGLMHMVNYRRSRELLMETPPSVPESFSPDPGRARAPIERALAEGRAWLEDAEAMEVLSAYGVPVVATHTARSADEVAAKAAEIGGPIALKILSPEIPHRSEVRGLLLDVAGPAAARDAAETMRLQIGEHHPQLPVTGFTVQPMVRRPGSYELIIGVIDDPQFGPAMLFGHGGAAAPVVNDFALGLPPMNMHLAREVMSHTQIYRLLRGYRGLPAANLDAVALTLIKVAQLVTDFAEIRELEINPFLADEYGCVTLDARIRVASASGPSTRRLAIRPYPKELEEQIPLGDGRTLLLRPVVPEDEPSLQQTFALLTQEEIRLRFFAPMKTLSHVMAARFTQIDYDREMALILTEHGIPGKTEIYGVVSITADSANQSGEYALLVRGDMTGMGLGIVLMRRIIDFARRRGLSSIFGDVLQENVTMLKLCRVLGFDEKPMPGDPTLVRATLDLSEGEGAA